MNNVVMLATAIAGISMSILAEHSRPFRNLSPKKKGLAMIATSMMVGIIVLLLSYAGVTVDQFTSPLDMPQVGMPVEQGSAKSLVNGIVLFLSSMLAFLMSSQGAHVVHSGMSKEQKVGGSSVHRTM